MKKKIICMLLVLCLALLSPSALAADPIPTADVSTGIDFSSALPIAETVYTAGGGTVTYKPAVGGKAPAAYIG